MKKEFILICFLSIGLLYKSIAQSAILDSYIQAGLQNNLSLKTENLELQKAIANIAIAKSNFAPKLTFAPNYSLAAGGRKLSFPIGDLLNPVYSTLNQLTKTNKFPQVENVNQQLAPNNFHDTKLSFQYPIFNTDIQYNYLIQKELLTSAEAKKKVLENEIKHQIAISYFQYLQTLEGIKIIEESRKLLNEFIRFNQKLVNNNVATKDIVYAAEYELAKLNQQEVGIIKNQEMAKTYLNYLMNRDYKLAIEADTNLVKKLPNIESLDVLRAESLTHRNELNQIKSGIKVSESAIKLQEMNAKRPQVFIGGNTGFQGFGYKFKDQAYLVAQLGLSFDLYHGNEKKHKIEAAKISKIALESKMDEVEQQIQLQVSQAYFETEAAIKSLESAQEAIKKADKMLPLIMSKYRNGQCIYIEVLKAQNDQLVAKMTESLGRNDVWVKKAMLDKVLGR
jgi:outer membrane protein